MIWVIERIRYKNGKPHERETRRKGQRVRIEQLALSAPLILSYIDDGDKTLKTSAVEAYSGDGLDAKHLTVQTRNSVYTFRKVTEE